MSAEKRNDPFNADARYERRLQISKLRRHLCETPELHYLFFELTDRCNLHCMHCGSGCEAHNAHFLDTQTVISMIRSIAEREPRTHICLTGGEPFLHPDFDVIARTLHETHLYWSVVTNATLIDDRTARMLSECGVYSVSVSLDGDEMEHDRLRGTAGAYQLAVRGIHHLRRYGIRLQITTVVTKRTLNQLDEIGNAVRAMDVCSWKLVNIEPIGRALEHKKLLLDHGEFLRLLDYIRSERVHTAACGSPLEVTYGCSHMLPLAYEEEVRGSPFLCGAGITIAGVQCNGDIGACLDVERRPELVQGNVYRDDFWDVWEHRFSFFRTDRTRRSEECRNCPQQHLCGGDSLHTWDFDHASPRMCWLKGYGPSRD